MHTLCPNPRCGQIYHTRSDFIGRVTRCKRCDVVFVIRDYFNLTSPPKLIRSPAKDLWVSEVDLSAVGKIDPSPTLSEKEPEQK